MGEIFFCPLRAEGEIRLAYSNPGGVTAKLVGGSYSAVTVFDQSGLRPTTIIGGDYVSESPAIDVVEDIVEDSAIFDWLLY